MLLAPKIVNRIPSIKAVYIQLKGQIVMRKNHLVLLHSGYNASYVSTSPEQPEQAKRPSSLIFCALEISE